MKKILGTIFLVTSMFANTEFETLKSQIQPIKGYLSENSFYGHWTAKSLDSSDKLNYFYDASNRLDVLIYFSSINSELPIDKSMGFLV